MATDGMFYLWPSPTGIMFKQSAPSTNIDNPEVAVFSNWNKWKVLVPATDRVQFATFLDRPINDRLAFFGDLLFYRAYSRTGREPVNAKNTDDQGIYLRLAARGIGDVLVHHRLAALPQRQTAGQLARRNDGVVTLDVLIVNAFHCRGKPKAEAKGLFLW